MKPKDHPMLMVEGNSGNGDQLREKRLQGQGDGLLLVPPEINRIDRNIAITVQGPSKVEHQAIVEAFDGLIYVTSAGYEVEYINQRFLERLGLRGNPVGQKCFRVLHGLDRVCAWCVKHRVLRGETVYREVLNPRDNRWYSSTEAPIRHTDGRTSKLSIIQDITERKLTEELIKKLAYHDALTGLPNRMLCQDRLKMALAQAQRHRRQVAVMMLDLDFFKQVNDIFGHRIGDRLLQVVGSRLTGLLRKSDTVARLGGDEFIVISPEISRVTDAAKVSQKILDSFRAPFICEEQEVRVTASIGMAIYPLDGRDPDTLLRHADIAMYCAKREGRNNYQRYVSDLKSWRQRTIWQ
jgi:diguanylate cyclase (GGDEF)-like protein/PAS domain S-box-containing protein